MKRIYDVEQSNLEERESTKSQKAYKTWEQKMTEKGYKYVKALYESVPTYIFASPRRQAEIALLNKKHLKSVEKKRKEAHNEVHLK